MPYYLRPYAPGSVQHLIARFANKEFRIAGDPERTEYLRRTALVLPRIDILALAYALMSSHVHWAVFAGLDPPSRFILPIHSAFARWLNVRQSRSGHVFMERFRLLVFEGETIANLLAYLHNNPVRAGVVADPADCSWTSHRAYIGQAPRPAWLNVELGLSLAGFDASPRGRLAFHEYVRARAGRPRDSKLSGAMLAQERTVVREALGSAAEIGAGVVSDRAGVDVLIRPDAIAAPNWDGDGLDVLSLVSNATGVSVDTLRSRSRRRRVVQARRLALLTWTRFLRRPQSELLSLLGLSSSAGSQLLAADTAVAELDNDASELSEFLRSR